jgi:hypothetical protein
MWCVIINSTNNVTVMALIMVAASSSEKSANFYQTTQRSNPDDSHLGRRQGNLKYHRRYWSFERWDLMTSLQERCWLSLLHNDAMLSSMRLHLPTFRRNLSSPSSISFRVEKYPNMSSLFRYNKFKYCSAALQYRGSTQFYSDTLGCII